MQVIDFTAGLFYLRAVGGGGIRYAVNRRLGGPHVQSGSFRKEKSLVSAGIRTSNRPTRGAVIVPKTLSQIQPKNLFTLVGYLHLNLLIASAPFFTTAHNTESAQEITT